MSGRRGTSSLLIRVLLAAAACVAVACAARAPGSRDRLAPVGESRTRLDLVAMRVLPTGESLPGDEGSRVGGLSGCAFDKEAGRLVAVTDDRDQPRVFDLDLRVQGSGLDVTVMDVVPVADHDPRETDRRVIDMEAIAMARRGEWAVASEGLSDHGVGIPPAIALHRRDGAVVGWLDIPEAFLPGQPGTPARGTYPNQALESLTRTPDGRLITASEGPLLQDGPVPGFDEAATVRILEYVPAGETWRPARQFAYELSPVSMPVDFGPSTLSTGVAELFALDDNRLLVLERSYVGEQGGSRRGTNVVRVYEVTLGAGEDVSGLPSLRGRAVRTFAKRLVLDLESLKPQLAHDLPTLENFEAMCEGPRLADGAPSLLLISDNNFSRRQRTAFLLFRIGERNGP